MKTFLDRLGFVLHRPRFFGKTFTSIVTQGIYGGDKIVDYLDFVSNGLGFNTVKGGCLMTLDPMTEKQQGEVERALARHANRYHATMEKPGYPAPTLFKLMIFRMSRTRIRLELDDSFRDYTNYSDNGWFESDHYYPVRLGLLKKVAGQLFDRMSARVTTAR